MKKLSSILFNLGLILFDLAWFWFDLFVLIIILVVCFMICVCIYLIVYAFLLILVRFDFCRPRSVEDGVAEWGACFSKISPTCFTNCGLFILRFRIFLRRRNIANLCFGTELSSTARLHGRGPISYACSCTRSRFLKLAFATIGFKLRPALACPLKYALRTAPSSVSNGMRRQDVCLISRSANASFVPGCWRSSLRTILR